jgi:molybdopterin/thiamine biosynthesis adenylyltransferase
MSRYSQQIQVEEIGFIGQNLISNAKVLIIGAGGLGTPVAIYLAASGVGQITIIDGDIISTTNLHRQFVFSQEELGLKKVDLLVQQLRKNNSTIIIDKQDVFFTVENADQLIQNCDVICDCTDNVETRILVDSKSAEFQKPLIYAAVKDWQGYLTVLNYKNKVRLTDVFPEEQLIDFSSDNCSSAGIVNTTCGILGMMQATEVLKIILQQEIELDGSILCVNTLKNKFVKLKLNSF